jgi:N6-adenosine-specific RNA methylase IME4
VKVVVLQVVPRLSVVTRAKDVSARFRTGFFVGKNSEKAMPEALSTQTWTNAGAARSSVLRVAGEPRSGGMGFDYRTNFCWVKERKGSGYWNRSRHEVLLLGARGRPVAPSPGEQVASVIERLVGAHSEKPAVVHELVEAMFPSAQKAKPSRDASSSGVIGRSRSPDLSFQDCEPLKQDLVSLGPDNINGCSPSSSCRFPHRPDRSISVLNVCVPDLLATLAVSIRHAGHLDYVPVCHQSSRDQGIDRVAVWRRLPLRSNGIGALGAQPNRAIAQNAPAEGLLRTKKAPPA